MKNKIAVKLMLYFTGILLVFALIIGGVFYQVFKQHTVDIKKQSMRAQAGRLAAVLSENLDLLERRHGDGIANSRFVNFIDDMNRDIVWVVDSERNLNINKKRLQRMLSRHRQLSHSGSGSGEHPLPALPRDSREAYARLPAHIREQVERGFAGHSFVVDEYNDVLDGIMLTVGEPVTDKQGRVRAVVLLHSPVQGLKDSAWAGLRILLLSVLAAMILGMVLSVLLSWRFTRPLKLMRNNAERLAEHDYSARNALLQQDEVGELARTLDVLAQRLELAEEEGQKLERLRREFIANISHELRTPVTVIRGSLEALRDGVVEEPEEVAEFHEQMYKESVFLQRLINDLLELSRLQNTDFPIEKERLDLCDVVRDAVRGARQLGKEKGVRIDAELDSGLYLLDGDYGRLRQMLMIFLHNSIKFSAPGASVEVRLTGRQLQITDHGCGMRPEDVSHAFERFYRARNEQNKSGSGLGLAIARQIARRHGMELELASKQGEGTVISVLLPERQEEEDNEKA